MLLAGMLLSFVPPEPDRWLPSLPGSVAMLEQGLVTMVAAMGVALVACYFLAKHFGSLPVFSRLVLRSPSTEAAVAAGRAISQGPWAVSVGESGKVVATLRPVGVAEFGQQRVDVVSSGGHIEAGRTVRVVEVHGNRVVVEEA